MNHIFLPLFCIFFTIVKRESLEVPTELHENLKIRIVTAYVQGVNYLFSPVSIHWPTDQRRTSYKT